MKRVLGLMAAVGLLIAEHNSIAAVGYTSLSFSGNLGGFSETWMDPFNTIDEQCQTFYAYGEEWFECYVIQASGVSVEGQLVNPNSTVVYNDSAFDWFQATVNYWIGAPVQPGTWTAAGSHSMEANGHISYCLPFQGCGEVPIGFMNIFLGYSGDQEVVLPPCSFWTSISLAVVAEMAPWDPIAYERGATVVCSNDLPAIAYRRDSFKEVFGGSYNATNDPCKAGLVPTGAIAGLHSHPYFNSSSEMNRENGCHNFKGHTSAHVGLANHANKNFTAPEGSQLNDHKWGHDTNTDLYLLVPLADQIKRLIPTTFQTFPVWSQ